MHPRITLGIVAVLGAVATVIGIAISPAAPHRAGGNPLQAGIAALSANRLDEASRDFSEAVRQDPSSVQASYDLGVVLGRQGNVDGARAAYNAALALAPGYTPALFNLAELESDSNPPLAISLYRKVLDVKPGDANSLFNLGLLLVQGGDGADGKDLLRQAIAIDGSLRSRVPSDITL